MSDVLTTLRQWSGTASSNKPADTDVIGSGLGDNIRTIQSVIRTYLASQSATVVPSAGVADLSTATGHWVPISGNSTVTGFGTEAAGIEYVLTFTGAPPLINSTAVSLPGAATVQAAAGDVCVAESLGSGNWRIWGYSRADATPSAVSAAQTFLGSDVSLNNTANYFNIVNTGSIGASGQKWLIRGVCCLQDTGGSASFLVRIWDGSSVVYVESNITTPNSNLPVQGIAEAVVTLTGATTFHLSAKDGTRTTGSALTTGNSGTANKATWITAMRLT